MLSYKVAYRLQMGTFFAEVADFPEASAFGSPAGNKSVALEWRVGRVGNRGWYELDDHWRKEQASGRAVDIPIVVIIIAGIVADSIPEREYEECVNKARALFRAIELAEAGL